MKKKEIVVLLGVVALVAGGAMLFDASVAHIGEDAQAEVTSEVPPIVDFEFLDGSGATECAQSDDGSFLTACNCLDQCRFDFQCGPGGSCNPVGPCGCKECASSQVQ